MEDLDCGNDMEHETSIRIRVEDTNVNNEDTHVNQELGNGSFFTMPNTGNIEVANDKDLTHEDFVDNRSTEEATNVPEKNGAATLALDSPHSPTESFYLNNSDWDEDSDSLEKEIAPCNKVSKGNEGDMESVASDDSICIENVTSVNRDQSSTGSLNSCNSSDDETQIHEKESVDKQQMYIERDSISVEDSPAYSKGDQGFIEGTSNNQQDSFQCNISASNCNAKCKSINQELYECCENDRNEYSASRDSEQIIINTLNCREGSMNDQCKSTNHPLAEEEVDDRKEEHGFKEIDETRVVTTDSAVAELINKAPLSDPKRDISTENKTDSDHTDGCQRETQQAFDGQDNTFLQEDGTGSASSRKVNITDEGNGMESCSENTNEIRNKENEGSSALVDGIGTKETEKERDDLSRKSGKQETADGVEEEIEDTAEAGNDSNRDHHHTGKTVTLTNSLEKPKTVYTKWNNNCDTEDLQVTDGNNGDNSKKDHFNFQAVSALPWQNSSEKCHTSGKSFMKQLKTGGRIFLGKVTPKGISSRGDSGSIQQSTKTAENFGSSAEHLDEETLSLLSLPSSSHRVPSLANYASTSKGKGARKYDSFVNEKYCKEKEQLPQDITQEIKVKALKNKLDPVHQKHSKGNRADFAAEGEHQENLLLGNCTETKTRKYFHLEDWKNSDQCQGEAGKKIPQLVRDSTVSFKSRIAVFAGNNAFPMTVNASGKQQLEPLPSEKEYSDSCHFEMEERVTNRLMNSYQQAKLKNEKMKTFIHHLDKNRAGSPSMIPRKIKKDSSTLQNTKQVPNEDTDDNCMISRDIDFHGVAKQKFVRPISASKEVKQSTHLPRPLTPIHGCSQSEEQTFKAISTGKKPIAKSLPSSLPVSLLNQAVVNQLNARLLPLAIVKTNDNMTHGRKTYVEEINEEVEILETLYRKFDKPKRHSTRDPSRSFLHKRKQESQVIED